MRWSFTLHDEPILSPSEDRRDAIDRRDIEGAVGPRGDGVDRELRIGGAGAGVDS